MTLQLHDYTEEPDGDYQAKVDVLTVDAAMRERWYRVCLTDDETFGDGCLLAGKQIHPSRRPAVSDMAYDAARQHFRDHGFEVHG